MMIPYSQVFLLAAAVFCLGLICLLTRRHLIMNLIGVEVMMNAAAILFLASALRWHQLEGQAFVLFIIGVAATEVAVGLALIIAAYRSKGSLDPDRFTILKW
jgi:NADH-quinone oxidoreductase subunit K